LDSLILSKHTGTGTKMFPTKGALFLPLVRAVFRLNNVFAGKVEIRRLDSRHSRSPYRRVVCLLRSCGCSRITFRYDCSVVRVRPVKCFDVLQVQYPVWPCRSFGACNSQLHRPLRKDLRIIHRFVETKNTQKADGDIFYHTNDLSVFTSKVRVI
jgi:hypothetical protein